MRNIGVCHPQIPEFLLHRNGVHVDPDNPASYWLTGEEDTDDDGDPDHDGTVMNASL